jgi:hypothetical protein
MKWTNTGEVKETNLKIIGDLDSVAETVASLRTRISQMGDIDVNTIKMIQEQLSKALSSINKATGIFHNEI